MVKWKKNPVDTSEVSAENPKKENPARKRKGFHIKKKHIKWYVLGAILIAIVVFVLYCSRQVQQVSAGLTSNTDFTELTYGDLRDTISATGVVESADKTNVYSSMSYTVEHVLVKVGDIVQAGDTLLELDRASIEKQITEKELSIEASQNSSSQSVETATDSYRDFKEGLEQGTNSSLISANSSVQNAYDNYMKAIKSKEDYERSLRDGTSVISQANAYESAERAYSTALQEASAAQAAMNKASTDMAAGPTNPALDQLYNDAKTRVNTAAASYQSILAQYNAVPPGATADQVQVAQKEYELAQEDLQKAKTGTTEALAEDYAIKKAANDAKQTAAAAAKAAMDNAEDAYQVAFDKARYGLADYEIAIDTAYKAYETALKSRTAAEVAADNQLNSYRNSLETARIAASGSLAEYQLEEMRKDLEKASITAPVSGTITAIYAKEGASGSGLLFVIENTDNLIIQTNVKEYDIGSVITGVPVSIKTDATGDSVFEGAVSRIAPTANKNSQGETDTTGEVLFATEVKVTTPKTPLRIGMNVRLEYILGEEKSVFSIPYDAVYENVAGQSCVLVARPAENPMQYILEEISVETGMETDLDIAITGEGLEPGMKIMNTPSRYTPGQTITLLDAAMMQGAAGGPDGSGGGGMRVAVGGRGG